MQRGFFGNDLFDYLMPYFLLNLSIDAGELLTWARSFIGRVIRFESSNGFAVGRFYDDVRRMAEMYGGGEEA